MVRYGAGIRLVLVLFSLAATAVFGMPYVLEWELEWWWHVMTVLLVLYVWSITFSRCYWRMTYDASGRFTVRRMLRKPLIFGISDMKNVKLERYRLSVREPGNVCLFFDVEWEEFRLPLESFGDHSKSSMEGVEELADFLRRSGVLPENKEAER